MSLSKEDLQCLVLLPKEKGLLVPLKPESLPDGEADILPTAAPLGSTFSRYANGPSWARALLAEEARRGMLYTLYRITSTSTALDHSDSSSISK
jgi:hypothetical protein